MFCSFFRRSSGQPRSFATSSDNVIDFHKARKLLYCGNNKLVSGAVQLLLDNVHYIKQQ